MRLLEVSEGTRGGASRVKETETSEEEAQEGTAGRRKGAHLKRNKNRESIKNLNGITEEIHFIQTTIRGVLF